MIPYDNLRSVVVKGLRRYLGCPVIRTNQTAEAPPYPYVSYTVTTLMTENKGTYGEYDDGMARKPVNCIWSVTAQSTDNVESVKLANTARDWLAYSGRSYLNNNGVIVQSVGSVGNRDNILTYEYESKNGFDVVFWLFDEVENVAETIETFEFSEDTNAQLESRLDGVEEIAYSGGQAISEEDETNALLEDRLSGV